MTSSIDPTKPEDGAPALKAHLRANLAAAKAEIEALQAGSVISVKAHGAKGDTVELPGAGSISQGSTMLTVNGADFRPEDVGKGIQINGAGPSNTPSGTKSLCTTIAAVDSATQVALANPAATTVSTAHVMYGSDDTVAIQSAIDAAQAIGGGTVFLPPGKYKVMPQTDPEGLVLTYDNQPRCLTISGAAHGGVVFKGAGMNATRIICRTFGDRDPLHYWGFNHDGTQILRGHGILLHGVIGHDRRPSAHFMDLEIDGGAGKGDAHSFPPDTSTGDGWDGQHQGITASNDRPVGTLVMERVRVRRFRGEMVYKGGGWENQECFVSDCEIGDGNANCFNFSALRTYIQRTTMFNAYAGVEANIPADPDGHYYSEIGAHGRWVVEGCKFMDLSSGAGVLAMAQGGPALHAMADRSVTYVGNLFERCTTGILVRASNTLVSGNQFIDCLTGVSVAVTPDADLMMCETVLYNITIKGNQFYLLSRGGNFAIALNGLAVNGPIYDVEVADNFVSDWYAHVAHASGFILGISCWLEPDGGDRIVVTRNTVYSRRGNGLDDTPGSGRAPLWRDNVERWRETYGLRLVDLNAGTNVYFHLSEHLIYSSGAAGLTPAIDPAHYQEGTQIRLRGREGFATVTIPASNAHFRCEAERVISADRILTLEMRAGRFIEVGWSYAG